MMQKSTHAGFAAQAKKRDEHLSKIMQSRPDLMAPQIGGPAVNMAQNPHFMAMHMKQMQQQSLIETSSSTTSPKTDDKIEPK